MRSITWHHGAELLARRAQLMEVTRELHAGRGWHPALLAEFYKLDVGLLPEQSFVACYAKSVAGRRRVDIHPRLVGTTLDLAMVAREAAIVEMGVPENLHDDLYVWRAGAWLAIPDYSLDEVLQGAETPIGLARRLDLPGELVHLRLQLARIHRLDLTAIEDATGCEMLDAHAEHFATWLARAAATLIRGKLL